MRRMARYRTSYHCSFCGKEQHQVRRLIAGPKMAYICNECVSLFEQERQESGHLGKVQEERGLHCSFCGKSQQQARHLSYGSRGVQICDECVDLCREIIAEEFALQPSELR